MIILQFLHIFPNYPELSGGDADGKAQKPPFSLPRCRASEILEVQMTAEILIVSPDTVYEPFNKGELPGRKVGHK
jgi:hypothetical protein